MQKSSFILLLGALLGFIAALATAQQPSFPIDSLKYGFAKGVLISMTPICDTVGVPNTDATFTTYFDNVNGRIRVVYGCGNIIDVNAYMLCTPKPMMATAICRGGNCTCSVTPGSGLEQCPPPAFNQTQFTFLGVKSWYGEIKANKWQVNLPAMAPNGTSIFVYTSGASIAGFEVFINGWDEPTTTMIFKKWDVKMPDDVDFELPKECPTRITKQNFAVNPFGAFLPSNLKF